MAGYPGGSDLALEDAQGRKLSLIWVVGDRVEIDVDDGYGRWFAGVVLDRAQIIELAAHLICGLSRKGITTDRIIAACPAAETIQAGLRL